MPDLPTLLWPLFGICLTLALYACALLLHKRLPALHPLLLTTIPIIALLLLTKLPIERYQSGGNLLQLLLGPATVALAVPLYRRLPQIRAALLPILTSIAIGGTIAVATSFALTRSLGASRDVQLAMLSRSVTTPISIGIATQLHASTSLAATFTVLSGLLGAVIGPAFLRRIGIHHDLPIGLALGTASHGIGTASALRHSQPQAAAAGLAMALNGIFTSLLLIPLYPLLPSIHNS